MAHLRRITAAFSSNQAHVLALIGLTGLALVLRLLVWRWHELYPLGGDEQEYLNQALTLLRTRQYVELRLMRPPLYAIFLAACIVAFDLLIQNLRLVQAIISALTVIPLYLLTLQVFGNRRVALVAGLLMALNYTLAFTATELLTETLFLFVATIIFWLLAQITSRSRWQPVFAGVCLGALALIRSVALPLLALGAIWLLLNTGKRTAAMFVLAAILVIAPWTIRNYLTYHALIIIDTTGAENLWLDNDPAGREAVKRQLYALGDDMAARQRLATERGIAVILAHPDHIAAKVWREARLFPALQFFDDMRNRPAIWVPPLQVWLRLILGDGLWTVILLGGAAGLWLAPARRWTLMIAAPWMLYIVLSTLIFHVEPRYRLPLYPALIPYAAWVIVRLSAWRLPTMRRIPALSAAAITCAGLIALMLAHRPYPAEAIMLAQKHAHLWRAERALTDGESRHRAHCRRNGAASRFALRSGARRSGARRSAERRRRRRTRTPERSVDCYPRSSVCPSLAWRCPSSQWQPTRRAARPALRDGIARRPATLGMERFSPHRTATGTPGCRQPRPGVCTRVSSAGKRLPLDDRPRRDADGSAFRRHSHTAHRRRPIARRAIAGDHDPDRWHRRHSHGRSTRLAHCTITATARRYRR
jgi:hypothetical protein